MSTKVKIDNQKNGRMNKPLDAYYSIKELIFRKALVSGQKLNYKDLSEMLGVSKTPITNALNRLEYEGFVVYEANKGYRIKLINESEIQDLFEIRMEMECFNVKKAIKMLNTKNFMRLHEKYNLYTSYKPQFTDRKKATMDLDFHLEIARIGGNSYAIMYLKNIIGHILFRYRLEYGVEQRKELVELEHRRIYECIGERDTKGGVRYMREHLNALQALMLQDLKDIGQQSEIIWL